VTNELIEGRYEAFSLQVRENAVFSGIMTHHSLARLAIGSICHSFSLRNGFHN